MPARSTGRRQFDANRELTRCVITPGLQGRQFPVEVMYTVAPEESYVDAAITTALQVHLDEAPGDVLVFLTGQVWAQ